MAKIDTSKSGKYQIKYHVTDSDGAIKISIGILRLNSPHHNYTANKMVANVHVLLPFYLLFNFICNF